MKCYVFGPMMYEGFTQLFKAASVVQGTFNDLVYEHENFAIMSCDLDTDAINTLLTDPEYMVVQDLESTPDQAELVNVIAYIEGRGVTLTDSEKIDASAATKGAAIVYLMRKLRGETEIINPASTGNST